MAESWVLQTIFSALMSEALISSGNPPTNPSISVSTGSAGSGRGSYLYRPEVTTVYATYRGVRRVTSSNHQVDTFLGIPYARPPVGKLRFEKPQQMLASIIIRDASKFGNECHQMSFPGFTPLKLLDVSLPQDEDCLYLNIYKPVRQDLSLLPVMVWIHGGAFALKAGSQYDGSNLALKGVIVVTINYRLDIFGFLSTQDDAIPGNYGLLDQVMALNWVKENIRAFGGNPDLVTIFGHSAGSASVSLHLVSPLSSGLFQRAIMQSGSSLTPGTIYRPFSRISPKQIASLIGLNVGCVDRDNNKQLTCLRGISARQLKNASATVFSNLNYQVLAGPVVDRKFGFMPELPLKLWTQNRFNPVDTIRGFQEAEFGGQFGEDFSNFTSATFVEKLRDSFKAYALPNSEQLIKQMSETYVGNETDSKSILLDLIQAWSDIQFVGPTLIEADIESKWAPERKHFVYKFAHKSGLSVYPSWIPAVHGEENPFVFGVGLKEFHTTDKTPSFFDQVVGEEVQTLWTNFAKYGDPTRTIPKGAVKWETYTKDNRKVLQIDKSSQMLNYSNLTAAHFTSQILKTLDSSFPDQLVG